jgi:uncharacterized protein (DUF362 family)
VSREISRRDLVSVLGASMLEASVLAGRADGAAARAEAGRRLGVVATARLRAPERPDGTGGRGADADPGEPDRAALADALGRALAGATGAATAGEGLGRLFGPGDVVGIKLSCLAGRWLSPRVELVEALVDQLEACGVRGQRIIVFERTSAELERAGFTVRRSGGPYLCYGIDNDYERQPTTSGEIGSCYARLIQASCTALISFGVVKDHDLAGVSAGLKNWYGVIHNPNKYHDNGCDPYVADVVRHTLIRSRLRLTVLDGVRAQYHGGPAFRADTTFRLDTVAASLDPVAADAWAWKVLDAERARHGLPSLEQAGRPPRFLATAERHGLGIGDPARIREVQA